MKTKTSFGFFFGALVVACGGSDTVALDGGDDTGTGSDTAPASDSGGPDGSSSDATVTDTGTNDGSTLDSGAFNPANVSGLVLWLEANVSASITTGNGRVTQWADQTTHHNDAKGSLQVSTGTRNPTVKSGQINGLDVIRFNKGQSNTSGNMLVIADNADKSLQWGTGDFYVAIVGEFDNDPKDNGGVNFAVGNFFSKNVANSGTSFTGVAFYGNIPPATQQLPTTAGLLFMTASQLGDLTYSTTPYNDDKPHVFAMRRQGTQLDLYVDGASVNTVGPSSVDVSNASAPVRIGADGDANLVRLDGDIGEIYAVAGALSSSDQTNIQAYLKNKWKTP